MRQEREIRVAASIASDHRRRLGFIPRAERSRTGADSLGQLPLSIHISQKLTRLLRSKKSGPAVESSTAARARPYLIGPTGGLALLSYKQRHVSWHGLNLGAITDAKPRRFPELISFRNEQYTGRLNKVRPLRER